MKKIVAVYFSATGTTEKIVKTIALQLSEDLRLPMEVCDFTLPAARKNPLVFDEESLLVFGTPVYAGRVPNLMAKYLVTMRAGKCAAVAVSVYGNRDFDDALVETCDIHIMVTWAFLFAAVAVYRCLRLSDLHSERYERRIVGDCAYGIIHYPLDHPGLERIVGPSRLGC